MPSLFECVVSFRFLRSINGEWHLAGYAAGHSCVILVLLLSVLSVFVGRLVHLVARLGRRATFGPFLLVPILVAG